MTATTLPDVHLAERDHIHPEPSSFMRKYVFSLDHKIIGYQYMITGFLFFIIAGLLAEVIRIQLLKPAGAIISPAAYDGIYTLHGSTMVWMVIIPLMTGGFGNFVMPLQIGARDVAFPWLNMVSFWIFPVSAAILFASALFGAPDAGWTEYPPISLQGPPGTNLWCAAIFLIGISSTMTGLNFMVTTAKMRAPGMTWTRMPLFAWATFATAIMNMVATVALSAATSALFLERVFGVPFFDPAHGGSPILWQHMFWFYSHPAVYIMILPAFGIISEVLPVFARKPIFAYKMIAFSSVAIAVLSFGVWAHHMFTSGLAPWLQLPFMIVTLIIAVPTGIKIFSWLATLWGGKIHFSPAMLFAVGFLFTFTFGGVTGVFLASVPADLHEHGTYFVVAHFHYVLFGGSVFGLFSGIYFWWPKMTGRMMNETLGKWHFWTTFIGFNGTFMPMHWLGLFGMPRRYATYEAFSKIYPQAQFWNDFASVFSFLMASSTLLLIVNMLWSLRYGPRAGNNPWGARTLEWMISSPPPYYNFKHIPLVLANPYSYDQPLPYRNLDDEDTPLIVAPHHESPVHA
ncbi:MAG: cytochrome c oxidase subunit I [Vulcanimicrobiaceae bacterium]